MSSNREDLIQGVLQEFSVVLQLKLPLEHFSQFYEELHFNNVTQQEARETLMTFQNNSKLSMQETLTVANELFSRIQGVIEQWKAKNEENKAQCSQFLQSQVDFLMSDFRTSVVLKLISAPDVGLQDMETFLERRKIVLIDIFEKLSKPGDPQSSVDMKARLDEKLEGLKIETLEKQRLHLEQKTAERAQKVREEAKRSIMEIAMRLKSDLMAYQGNCPKDLVKGKLGEINYFLSFMGKALNEQHPNIYSAVLQTTAEVGKCLDEEDYKDMTAKEFAETLYEQLLYDFSEESQNGRPDSSEVDLHSLGSDDEGACATSQKEKMEVRVRKRNDVFCSESEGQLGQLNELHHFVGEEGIKEEKEKGDLDQDTSEFDARNSNTERGSLQFEDEGGYPEEEETQMTESRKSPVDKLKSSRGNFINSKKRVSKMTRTSHCNNSSRKSAKARNSSEPVAEAKCSRPIRQCVVVHTKKPMDDDECWGSSSEGCEDSTTDESSEKEMDIPVGSSKPDKSQSRLAGIGKLRLSDHSNVKPTNDKISYLYLDKWGHPKYRCNVCCRKCPQSMLRYHGRNCGQSDDPNACKECGKTFMTKSDLQKHALIHTGEKPFKCSKCPTKFTFKRALQNHLLAHLREKKKKTFICKPCKLSFVSGKELHIHDKMKHLGKLPFGCTYCDKRFQILTQLKYHVIVHSDERPFQCPTCGSNFAIKQILREHISRVHHRSRKTAIKEANQSAIDYLRRETNGHSDIVSSSKIEIRVASHIIQKAKLRLPEGTA